jgi:hypothetical protein
MTTHKRPETRFGAPCEDGPVTAAGEKRSSESVTAGGRLEAESLPENPGRSKPQTRVNFLDLTALVRSVQRSEGNPPCFSTTSTCDRMDCVWRSHCLGKTRTTR